jgi:hypothetical protein
MNTTAGAEVEMRSEEDGWEVIAHWSSSDPERPFTHGPVEVTVRLLPTATVKARQRGITSGVLRRAEALVTEMTTTMHASPEHKERDYSAVAEQYAATELAKMPGTPRDGEGYYSSLLDLYEFLDEFWGHPEPVNLLARLSGVSRDTMKTRLRQARLRAAK